jgi:hypothetical protein
MRYSLSPLPSSLTVRLLFQTEVNPLLAFGESELNIVRDE